MRKHVAPGFEVFGRMASNYATGGVNVAALEHFSQIKGGWGRIYEMPTRDFDHRHHASRQHGPGESRQDAAVDADDAGRNAALHRGVEERRAVCRR